MQSRYNYISFFILLVLCTACKKNNNAPYDYMESEDYFGLTKGNYVEYEVTEINHIPQTSNTILSDTIHYFVKYYIQDTIRDEFNNLKYIFEVKKKNIEGDSWSTSDIWTANYQDKNCELVVENQRIVKLKSPVNESTEWNPNIYNTLSPEEYSYSDINNSKVFGQLSFDSTVTVIQCDERNLIRYCKKQEIYAKGVGMIYKYYKDLEINNFDTLNIKNGTELFFTPVAYGTE